MITELLAGSPHTTIREMLDVFVLDLFSVKKLEWKTYVAKLVWLAVTPVDGLSVSVLCRPAAAVAVAGAALPVFEISSR